MSRLFFLSLRFQYLLDGYDKIKLDIQKICDFLGREALGFEHFGSSSGGFFGFTLGHANFDAFSFAFGNTFFFTLGLALFDADIGLLILSECHVI
jgi:hypothetical protein